MASSSPTLRTLDDVETRPIPPADPIETLRVDRPIAIVIRLRRQPE